MSNIYLAASYSRREEIRAYAERLKAETGDKVVSRWLWEEPTLSDAELLKPENINRAREVAEGMLLDLNAADCLLVFCTPELPSTRGGMHVEMGVSLALGHMIYLIGTPPNLFYRSPQINGHCAEFEEFMAYWQILSEPF